MSSKRSPRNHVDVVRVPTLTPEQLDSVEKLVAQGKAHAQGTIAALDALLATIRFGVDVRRASAPLVSAAPTNVERSPMIHADLALGHPHGALIKRASSSPMLDHIRESGRTRIVDATEITRPAELARAIENSIPLASGERAILAAIAAHGVLTREQIAIVTFYNHKAGHFGALLRTCVKRELVVEGEDHRMELTPIGRQELHRAPFPGTPAFGRSVREGWMKKLSKGGGLIVDALNLVHPRAITYEQLAQATGYDADAGHFGSLVRELEGLALVIRGKGTAKLVDELAGG